MHASIFPYTGLCLFTCLLIFSSQLSRTIYGSGLFPGIVKSILEACYISTQGSLIHTCGLIMVYWSVGFIYSPCGYHLIHSFFLSFFVSHQLQALNIYHCHQKISIETWFFCYVKLCNLTKQPTNHRFIQISYYKARPRVLAIYGRKK